MPYEGDSPIEAWEYWFDVPPSEAVRSSIEQRCKTHSAAEVVAAIGITGMKFPMILEDESRLKYMNGVLRREALKKIDPQRAEEEGHLDSICKYWEKKAISPWPLYRNKVRRWLQYVDADGIKAVIHVSRSWSDFHGQMDEIIAKTPKYQQEQAEQEARAQAEAAAEAGKLAVVPRRRRRRS